MNQNHRLYTPEGSDRYAASFGLGCDCFAF